jgi:glucosamine--fructose-6-phosphate aminotransferase (isomerizing)
MCGIVGYIGKKNALPILMDGLKKLEYRGYDSAGIAIIKENNSIKSFKTVGKVSGLEKILPKSKTKAFVGIAHTRWATHGKPSIKNCHPHSDCQGNIWVAHNGIIENYKKIRSALQKKGHKFTSETDTEVISHLIEEYSKKENDFKKAVSSALGEIEGTYGLVIINKNNPFNLIAAKKGSPLLLGVGKDEYIIASDASAIINYTSKVIYLEDGEVADVSKDGYKITFAKDGKELYRKTHKINWSVDKIQRKGYRHFMMKEINEQPETIENAIMGRADRFIGEGNVPILGGLRPVAGKLREKEKLIIVSCGTSYYAGLVGEYFLEEYAGIPTEVEYASEFRYRKPLLDKKTVVLAISQSGETADTLEAVREAKNKGALTLGIVNVVGSSIARETDAGIYNHAGPEIGVASTKAFTSQVSVLVLLALMLGRQRQMSFIMSKRIAMELKKMPTLVKKVLKKQKELEKIANQYKKYQNWLYLGRKYNYPIALEGALKLKEISYIHAEGYPAGEMKHGPIAMIDGNFPSLFIVPSDSVYEKVVSGMEEIKARGGRIFAIATEGNKKIREVADDVFYIPKTLEMLSPILSVIPLQMFAYYIGIKRGLDVDKPRNLAKSVTVE